MWLPSKKSEAPLLDQIVTTYTTKHFSEQSVPPTSSFPAVVLSQHIDTTADMSSLLCLWIDACLFTGGTFRVPYYSYWSLCTVLNFSSVEDIFFLRFRSFQTGDSSILCGWILFILTVNNIYARVLNETMYMYSLEPLSWPLPLRA